jgi:hypothetical protein
VGNSIRNGLGPGSVLELGQGPEDTAAIVVFAGVCGFDRFGAYMIALTTKIGPSLKNTCGELRKPIWGADGRRLTTYAYRHFLKQFPEGQIGSVEQEALSD